MSDGKKKAHSVAGTTEQAERESHWASGNPCKDDTTERTNGQTGISVLLLHGAENGLHLQDLARLKGWSEREVRQQIHTERRQGVPILSNNRDGYYLPGNDHERTACVRSLRHRAAEILAAAEAIERSGGN